MVIAYTIITIIMFLQNFGYLMNFFHFVLMLYCVDVPNQTSE